MIWQTTAEEKFELRVNFELTVFELTHVRPVVIRIMNI